MDVAKAHSQFMVSLSSILRSDLLLSQETSNDKLSSILSKRVGSKMGEEGSHGPTEKKSHVQFTNPFSANLRVDRSLSLAVMKFNDKLSSILGKRIGPEMGEEGNDGLVGKKCHR